jgi:hypothetical protein
MDKKNVQKSIWRNLFAQKRAALGNLRNFFGGIVMRAHMQSLFFIEIMHKKHMMQKYGPNRLKCSHGCPKTRVSYFQEKWFCVLGTGAKMRMSLFEGFLF